MTPLIDCVFLLLVFFLVTSVFKQDKSVLKLLLPETSSEVKQEVSEGFFIELSETEIAINGEIATVELLKSKSAAVQNKRAPVALKIDKKTPYEKVAEVASRVGYTNSSKFAQAFKEYTGCSPKEYRNKG